MLKSVPKASTKLKDVFIELCIQRYSLSQYENSCDAFQASENKK